MSHLILCLTKRKLSLYFHGVVLMVWLFSMFMTCSNHLTFLIKSDIRAGVERARLSPKIESLNKEIKDMEDAISQIVARPVTVVINEKIATLDRNKLYGLKIELSEAYRKESMLDKLFGLKKTRDENETTESQDPFFHRIALITDLSDQTISMNFNLAISVFLELAGVILWLEYSDSKKRDQETDIKIQSPVDSVNPANKPTVDQIRLFFRCGQQKAMVVYRLIEGQRREKAVSLDE